MSVVGRSRWRGLLAIMLAAAIFGITYGLSAPSIALELARRGYGELFIGANAAMQALGILTVARMLPRLAAAWGMQRLLVLALLLSGLVLMLFPFAAAWGLLLWFPLRYVLGTASESVLVTTESWVNQLGEERSRARTIAAYTAAVSAGMALGPLLLGHLGTGDAQPFLVGAGLAFAACLVVAIVRPPVVAMDEQRLGGSLAATVRLAPLAFAATALNAALETAGLTFLPMYAMKLGWSEQGATSLVTTLLVGAIVLQLPIGWLGDRFDRRRLMVLLSVLSALTALAWPAAMGIRWLGHALLFVWGGLFVGIYTLAVTSVGARYSGHELVRIYAGLSVAFGIGALLGPLLAGATMSGAHHGLPVFASVACAAFAVLAWRSRSPV